MSNEYFNFESLKKMSEAAGQMINAEMKIFENTFEQLREKLPVEDLGKLDSFKANMNKAIALAKDGKQDEALSIINNLTNVSKSN